MAVSVVGLDGGSDGEAASERRVCVLLVDDHDLVEVGLRVLLCRQRWVGRILNARSAAEAVRVAQRAAPAVALVDSFVGEELGVQICQAIRASAPEVRVLLMSSSGSLSQQAAFEAGASGVIGKDGPAVELLESVRDVVRRPGQFVWRPDAGRGPISVRQQQILDLMAVGATNRDIAGALALSVDTVKQHTSAIYRRLGVRNRAEAVHRAQRLGLLNEGHLAEVLDAANRRISTQLA